MVLVTEPLTVTVAVTTGLAFVLVLEASSLTEKLLYVNVSVLEPVVIVAPPLIASVNECDVSQSRHLDRVKSDTSIT